MTRRERILDYIKASLETIQTVNGYNTEIGLNVQLEQDIIPDSISYLVNVFEGDDSIIDDNINSAFISLPIEIEVFHESIQGHTPRRTLKHQIISDIKKNIMLYRRQKSIEISDISYPTVQRIDKETGSSYVVVSISFNVEYHERPGDPDY